MLKIRRAQFEEVDSILSLFEDEVRAGRMLPRSREMICAQLDDWIVAESYGAVIGCVSLVYFSQGLCEVRSLAVHGDYRGRGIASELVKASLDLAREHGIRYALALTRAPRVFERCGFQRDEVQNYPEKVWRDCAPCPFFNACDEIALTFDLRQEACCGS
jgi:N-acetylglutamate synthase-like GNAT family acetyltransferase